MSNWVSCACPTWTREGHDIVKDFIRNLAEKDGNISSQVILYSSGDKCYKKTKEYHPEWFADTEPIFIIEYFVRGWDNPVGDVVLQKALSLKPNGLKETKNYSIKLHLRESLTINALEKLFFKFLKTNPNIELYDNYSNDVVNIYSYGKSDYITLAKEFAEYIKQNNPTEAENITLMADAMYDDTYAVICETGKRKSVYFNFSDNTNDEDDSDIYVEYTQVYD